MGRRLVCRVCAGVMLLMLISALLAACGGGADRSAFAAAEFTDDLGRQVVLPRRPTRVAALLGSFADVWLLSGGEICAAPEDAAADFGLDLSDAVHLGGAHSPNLEALLSADPDFVLASASIAAHVEMQAVLENVGIPVAYFDVDCFGDYLDMLKICTEITGRDDLYEQNGLALQAQIEAARGAVEAGLPGDEKRTVLLLRASSGTVKAKGSEGTILGEMLADLGCINIADSDGMLLESLSVESVIRREPYRIFVVTMGSDTAQAMENLSRMMDENPAWGQLDAVKNGRLHVMDRRLFNIKPNGKWAEAYEKLKDILLG